MSEEVKSNLSELVEQIKFGKKIINDACNVYNNKIQEIFEGNGFARIKATCEFNRETDTDESDPYFSIKNLTIEWYSYITDPELNA